MGSGRIAPSATSGSGALGAARWTEGTTTGWRKGEAVGRGGGGASVAAAATWVTVRVWVRAGLEWLGLGSGSGLG